MCRLVDEFDEKIYSVIGLQSPCLEVGLSKHVNPQSPRYKQDGQQSQAPKGSKQANVSATKSKLHYPYSKNN